MTRRQLSLCKDGHEYIFGFPPGHEGEAVDEIMRLAGDGQEGLDWLDAATLAFQATRLAAADCCAALMAPTGKCAPQPRKAGRESDDDAKDGPCTTTSPS